MTGKPLFAYVNIQEDFDNKDLMLMPFPYSRAFVVYIGHGNVLISYMGSGNECGAIIGNLSPMHCCADNYQQL